MKFEIAEDGESASQSSETLPEQEQLLNQTELARLFKMSRNLVIERLNDAGIEPVTKSARAGAKYRLSEVEAILVHKVLKSDRKLEATERKLEAEAELKEIEVQKRRGELIQVSDVERGGVQLFRALHNRLVQYCDESALDISHFRNRGEVAHYQKDHVGKILLELRADPNNFIAKYLPDEL